MCRTDAGAGRKPEGGKLDISRPSCVRPLFHAPLCRRLREFSLQENSALKIYIVISASGIIT